MKRLTPDEFKAVAKRKGWKFKELAERWGISPVWLSNIVNNPQRAIHWDDAIKGVENRLPTPPGNKKRKP
jgi:transcriptional regulator with XRE-family HTH domain